MYGLIFPEGKLRETSRIIIFVIYYSNKDNSKFPNLPQREKQINHNINISFNLIYRLYGAFCICQFGPAFLSWKIASNSWQHFNGANKITYHPSSNLMDLHPKFLPILWSLEWIYQDHNGMEGIHRIQLIKCCPQFNVVDYPLETANGIQQWLINRQKRLKLWKNRMYHHGICKSWFSEEKVSIQKFLLLVK